MYQLSQETAYPTWAVEEFAAEHGLDVAADVTALTDESEAADQEVVATLLVDDFGDPRQRVTKLGVDYLFSRIDYRLNSSRRGSRVVAVIAPGQRAELVYQPKRSAAAVGNPDNVLTVSQGIGRLVSSGPEDESLTVEDLGPAQQPHIVAPGNRFYAVEAAEWSDEALIVSRLLRGWRNPIEGFNAGAIELQPGDHIVPPESLLDRELPVPYKFWDRYKTQYRAA